MTSLKNNCQLLHRLDKTNDLLEVFLLHDARNVALSLHVIRLKKKLKQNAYKRFSNETLYRREQMTKDEKLALLKLPEML